MASAERCPYFGENQTKKYGIRIQLPATSVTRSVDSGISFSAGESEEDSGAATPPPYYYGIPGIVPAYQGRSSGPPPSYDDVVNPNAPPPSYQSLFGQVREARKSSNGLLDLLRQLFLILIGTLGCTIIIGFLLLIPITMILVGIIYVNECRAENIPSFLVVGGLVWIVKNVLNCYNQFKNDSLVVNRPPPRRAQISNATNQDAAASSVLIVGQSQSDLASTTSSQSNPQRSYIGPSMPAPSHQADGSAATATATATAAAAATATTIDAGSATRQRASSRELSHNSNANSHRIRPPSLIGITSYKCESLLNYFLIVWFLAGCIVVYRIYEPDYENPLSSSYCNRTVYLYAFWLMTSAFIMIAVVLSCLCCLMASSLISCSHGR